MKPAATHPLQLLLGLAVWSAWFVAVYGGVSLACSLRPPPADAGALTAVNLALVGLTVVTALGLAAAARACLLALRRLPNTPAQARHRFIAALAAGLHAVAAISTVVVGLPLLWLPPCV